jgi:hypothetical protein
MCIHSYCKGNRIGKCKYVATILIKLVAAFYYPKKSTFICAATGTGNYYQTIFYSDFDTNSITKAFQNYIHHNPFFIAFYYSAFINTWYWKRY